MFFHIFSNSAPLESPSETQKNIPKTKDIGTKLRKSQWNSQQVPASFGRIQYLMEHLVMNNRKKKDPFQKKKSRTAKFTQTAEEKKSP